jgi:hypothetical protein
VRDGLEDVRALLPGMTLTLIDDELGRSGRGTVRRVAADSGTLIVKTFAEPEPGWVRESAALAMMPPGAPAPRLVAAGRTPPMVVMEDLGAGTCVADALLGADPVAAADAVASWAVAIASLHRATLGACEAFQAELRERARGTQLSESPLRENLEDAGRDLARHCAELDVAVPAGAFELLGSLAARLGGDGAAALTPADACPDNNVRVGDRLVLIDFEGAQWRHVAWDVAYLMIPWPSCWCAWRMPDPVAERAVAAYRSAVGLPYVDSAEFGRDLAAAVVGWALMSTSWFLARAMANEPPSNPARVAPTRRAMILHRLDVARRSPEVPALAELAGRLRDALVARWGDLTLALAPAFRDPA